MIGVPLEGMRPFSVVTDHADGGKVVVRNGFASSPEAFAAQAFNQGEAVIVGEEHEPGTILAEDGTVTPPDRPAAVTTVAQVKAEQGRRLKYTDWLVTRAADPTDGRPIPEAIVVERRRIRERATLLEAMEPIPLDYRDDKHWT